MLTFRRSFIGCAVVAMIVVATANFGFSSVTFRHGSLEIPTYTFGRSQEAAPLFKVKNGKGLYPYAAMDRTSLSPKPVPLRYESLTLENEYLEVTVLPELGGRIWSARDKLSERHIFYYTPVIKPSTYNQRDAWPVGNIEVYGPYDAHMLTWPGEPWPWAVRDHEDGSKSLVLSHIDHFFRNKISMEVTVRPGRSFIELTVSLHNRNAFPNRYLLWTNAGIPVTEGSRFVYPMSKTIGHDSADLGEWPVSRGVDLSWYKNNEAMLGVFGLDIYDDFIAAYDYQGDFGTICYTDRRIARGIKTWTWGVGEAGRRHLEAYTDSGIPYIEVQSGRFVWDGNYEFLDPGKTDGWTEYWYGAANLGGLTTATRDVALHVNYPAADRASLRITATGNYPSAVLSWQTEGQSARSEKVSLAVGKTITKEIRMEAPSSGQTLRIQLKDGDRALLAHTVYPQGGRPESEFASDSIPREFGPTAELSMEEIFQKGLTLEKLGRIEEARKAYDEALLRDRHYTAPNIRLGLLSIESLDPQRAIEHFNRVLERDPANGEGHYYLAITYSQLENFENARRHFYRLLPSSEKFYQRDFGLGVLALKQGQLAQAKNLLASAAGHTPFQLAARQAYAYALRKTGDFQAAGAECGQILEIDPTNAFAQSELVLMSDWSDPEVRLLERATANHPQGYLELATDYMRLSAWKELDAVLHHALSVATSAGAKGRSSVAMKAYPLLYYYRAYALQQLGQQQKARELIQVASRQDLQISLFPFRSETLEVLEEALSLVPLDGNASSLIGDLYYDRGRQEEAISYWQRSIESDPNHMSSLRNLGWALAQRGRIEQGAAFLSRALALQPENLEITTGLADLYLQLGKEEAALQVVQRALEKRPQDDQLVELLIKLEAQNGHYDRALQVLERHRFGPRHQSDDLLHLYQAVQLLKSQELAAQGSWHQAVARIEKAGAPPANLGLDDFAALQSSRLLFFKALAYEAAGEPQKAAENWQTASGASDEGPGGEGLFKAIALDRTGRKEQADEWFHGFQPYLERAKNDPSVATRAQAYYLSAIYSIYRGHHDKARENLQEALRIDQSHLFSRHARLWLEHGFFGPLAYSRGSNQGDLD